MSFTDIAHLSPEARAAIAYCVEHGLLRGVASDLFAPDLPTPRWQQAIVLMRLHQRTREFPDAIAERIAPATVMLVDEATGAQGSGVSVGGGYIVTNAHVVLRPDGTTPFMVGIHWSAPSPDYAMGPVVAIRPAQDLALVRAAIGERRLLLPRLPLAEAPVQLGEPLTVMGSPVGLIGSLSHGVVSHVHRQGMSYQVGGVNTRFGQVIQTDAPINPGNSGGAAVNRRGELVGIPSFKLVHLALEGLGFIIGLPDVRELLASAGHSYIPAFSRPDYAGSPEGYAVSLATHSMPTAQVTHVIVHHSGEPEHRDTSALEIHRAHRQRGWSGIGYHFVIRWDGHIELGRSELTRGSHTRGMNERSWGVVLAGNFNLALPTAAQVQSFRWLWRYLNGVRPGLILSGHRDHVATDCPGHQLQLAALVA